MTRVIVGTPGCIRQLAGLMEPGSQWVYLGKDSDRQAAIAFQLGEDRRFSLCNRLHEAAESLRQPFLDFIAEFGKFQPDQIAWWSSSCSWKDMVRSQLFLLICYQHLFADLVKGSEAIGHQLVVILEDSWLFRQLKSAYGGSSDIHFVGVPSLWPQCLKAIILGTGARAVWSLRLLRNYLRQRRTWRVAGHAPRSATVGLYSDPQSRCILGKDSWKDPYLGELDCVLEKEGHQILRFSPPETGGFEDALAERSRYFSPLVLWLSPLSLFLAAFATWRPKWPLRSEIAGLPIHWLLRREWWLDRWRSSYLIFRVFYDCLLEMLASSDLRLIIFPYENQPWEKLLILAANARGVSTVGYQHGAGLARFMLAYFPGTRGAEWIPLPDLIVTSGHYSYELLAVSGVPRERMIMGGNLRHQYLRSYASPRPLPPAQQRLPVLVALPVEPDLMRHLIHALMKAFPDAGVSEGIEFMLKPHPMCPVEQSTLTWAETVLNGNFEEALQRSAAVLYSGSGTGMEAIVMGRVVLRYRSELLLNTDYSELRDGHTVMDCDDSDLREKVLALLKRRSLLPLQEDIDTLLRRIFPTPDTDAWVEAVSRLCRKHW